MSRLRPGENVELRVERIVPRGLGMGFAEGLTVFVALAAPGDLVRVELSGVKGRIAFGEIVEIIEPGPGRSAPPCPYFGSCGGCNFQQLNYDAQLAAKAAIIRDCLRRIGKIDWEGDIPVIASPQQLEYRGRVRWQVDSRLRFIGYYARKSHDIIDIQECPKLTPALNRTLSRLRAEADWDSYAADHFEIEAVEGDGGEVSVHSAEFAEPPAEMETTIAGERFRFTAGTFVQANRSLTDELVNAAVGDISGEIALDLYCGVGLFSVPLARRFASVVGVETNTLAVDLARGNAVDAGLSNAEFVARSVDDFLRSFESGPVDQVLLDPPRAGTGKGTMAALLAVAPKRISYVSCEPSILARDMRVLIDGGYTIQSIVGLDMFPQTHHVETVVHLVPGSAIAEARTK